MLGTEWICTCIQQCALEYNDGIISDHQGLYIDLDASVLFGGATKDPVATSFHGFTSKNKRNTKKCLNNLDQYFIDHKICNCIDW
jgi:hypothetical protein